MQGHTQTGLLVEISSIIGPHVGYLKPIFDYNSLRAQAHSPCFIRANVYIRKMKLQYLTNWVTIA